MFDKEPEDMFAGVEPTKQEPLRPAGALSPTVPGMPGTAPPVGASPAEVGEDGGGPGKKKMILVLSAVILVLMLGGGGFLVWRQFSSAPEATLETPGVNTNLPTVNIPVEIAPEVPETPAEIPPAVLETAPVIPPAGSIDSDEDGLTDEEEATLGTDATNTDTDLDGLSDGEEVNIYFTDPLNTDTDGDTYLDGAEVDAGYDPNGLGKLPVQP